MTAEPVFTLRARDAFAPGLILQWVMLAEQANLGYVEGQTIDDAAHLEAKLADARHCARAMVEWQRNNTHKIPD